MEEKKTKSGSVGIVLCLLLIIVALGVGGYFIYNLSIERNNIQTQINEIDKKIEELGNNVSNIVKEMEEKENTLTEEDAKKLIKDKYELSVKLFTGIEMFEVLNEDDPNTIKENEGDMAIYLYPITNYDEIIDKYLSKDIIEYFEEKNTLIVIKNDKKYTTDGGSGFVSYDGIEEITDINITAEKISATIKIKCNDLDGEFVEYRESEFSIVKDGENWLIEKFEYDKII